MSLNKTERGAPEIFFVWHYGPKRGVYRKICVKQVTYSGILIVSAIHLMLIEVSLFFVSGGTTAIGDILAILQHANVVLCVEFIELKLDTILQ